MHFVRQVWCPVVAVLLSVTGAIPWTQPSKRQYIEERDGINYHVYEDITGRTKMSIVKNSGICETTPGVNQYSGYFSVGTNMSMFFWFFEARNNPSQAPLAAWLQGGPGCSSMIGLFQENGPCFFVGNSTSPSLNPYSWNNYANMIYIDQPIGAGFSFGTQIVNSTYAAAPYVWSFLQVFLGSFPEYESRDFGIWTESYGGHWGPEFAAYFEQQNALIGRGKLEGEKIDLVAVGINNGLFDSAIQEKATIDYSWKNPYRPLINASLAASLYNAYYTECIPAEVACKINGSAKVCNDTDNTCQDAIDNVVLETAPDFDVYDIREPSDDAYPPDNYEAYLLDPEVAKTIGAATTWQRCSDISSFGDTADFVRSFLDPLSTVVQSGTTVLIWAGDADWLCNWVGCQGVAEALKYPGQVAFVSRPLASYYVNGTVKGLYKSVDNLSFVRVYEAGHEASYYQPETALQLFIQTMQQKPATST